MATEITEAVAVSAVSVRRGSYMLALSHTEQIMSETRVLPTDFTVSVSAYRPDQPEVRFYFHRDLEGLRRFAEQFFLTEAVEYRADGSVYVEAKGGGLCRDVQVEAWTLFPADAAAEIAAAVAA